MTGHVECAANSSTVAWLKRPQHHGIDVLAEGAGEVGHALALAEADRRLPPRKMLAAAELGHRRLEADARAQRRLLEDHAQHAPGRIGTCSPRCRAAFRRAASSSRWLISSGAQVEQVEKVTHGNNRSSDGQFVSDDRSADCLQAHGLQFMGFMPATLLRGCRSLRPARRRSGSAPAAGAGPCRACS